MVGYADTPMFRMDVITVREGSLALPQRSVFSVLYVLSGSGLLKSGDQVFPLRQGQQYFLPAGTGAFSLSRRLEKELKLLHCFGPQV